MEAAKRIDEISSGGTGREDTIYRRRFSPQEEATREKTWQILCNDFFQTYVHQYDTVLDVGAGDGLFIRNIRAAKRIAVDSSPHVNALQQSGIKVLQIPADQMSFHVQKQVDVVFMSNFLEHMLDKKAVLTVLEECRKVLKPGGRLLILQPNIRYVGPAYWDYIDHHVALTEHSLVEALEVSGLTIDEVIPRFLPYTAKSRLGAAVNGGDRGWMVSAYLRMPILWRFFGQQTFIVAHR